MKNQFRKPSPLLSLLVLTGCTLGLVACSSKGVSHLPPEQTRALLLNRNWLDRMPEKASDRLHVFRFVPQMGGGVYQDRTLYAGSFELFTFEHTGEQIRFVLPHKSERKTVRYVVDRISDKEAPPFDLRLMLEGSPRGPSLYYGIERETGSTVSELDAELTKKGQGLP